jgi:GH15 family glucan-1,4-alpha-glucosidase
VRNWDYRYTWIRDAAFTVFAMRRIGFMNEADAFLGWVLDAFDQSRQPRIMYTLDGGPVPDELEDSELEGYRRSAPVRWGNGAADQRQHDVYGEVLDCADQWVRAGGQIQPGLWNGLSALAGDRRAARSDRVHRAVARGGGRAARDDPDQSVERGGQDALRASRR